MKRALAPLLAVALLGAVAAPVAATTTRYNIACTETYSSNAGGTFWIADGVAYLRDAVYVYDVSGDDHCAGTLTVVVNFNLDLASSTGALWGTGTTALDAFNGGFRMTWTAHWTASDPLRPDATDIWAGKVVGHGYGELEGWQSRESIIETTHASVVEEGYVFEPGS